MNKGKGPWFIVLLKNLIDKTYTLYCHTYAYQYSSLMNNINKKKTWKTLILVGPFNYIINADKFQTDWLAVKPNIDSCLSLCIRYNVHIWEITPCPKPDIKKKRLTLNNLDKTLTIGIIRLINSKRQK